MYKEIAADSWIYQLATLINFTTTLAIFPGSTVLIEPQNPTGKLKNPGKILPYFLFITTVKILLNKCHQFL